MTKRYKVKRREYPDICPKCGTKNIEHWGLQGGYGNSLHDAATCKECDFEWGLIWKYEKWTPVGKYSES